MTQMDARITELMARLTALERERAEILAEINTLRSLRSEKAAAIKAVPSAKAGDPIDRNSTIEKKIALFRRLFRGRTDVFPIRWENRTTGRSGYAPACTNEWQRGICEKPKVKCSACPNQAFQAVDEVPIERHLRGTDTNGAPFVMGVYPMLADNTCSFLAADFDEGEWRRDAFAFGSFRAARLFGRRWHSDLGPLHQNQNCSRRDSRQERSNENAEADLHHDAFIIESESPDKQAHGESDAGEDRCAVELCERGAAGSFGQADLDRAEREKENAQLFPQRPATIPSGMDPVKLDSDK